MTGFIDRASSKLSKLSDEQIERVINSQKKELELRNNILDSVNTGFAVIDSKCKILYVNKYLSDLLQFDIKAIKRQKTPVTSISNNIELTDKITSFISKKDDSFDYRFDYEHSIYGALKIRVTSVVLKEYFIFVFRDITFMEKIKREFQKNESLASMTTMAAGMAHEIKNPLASMSIYLQLIKKKLDKDGILKKEDAEKSLNIVFDEINRLNAMAVDFLFAVKPMNVELKIQDINPIVSKICNLGRAEIEDCNIEFKMNLGASLPKVAVDSGLIEQCILNLIRNAIQSFKDLNGSKLIEVNTFIDGDFVYISVSDNGCGMTEEQITRIFEPYYTTKDNGTGLGLTTIFKIMKEHNGEVNVTSHIKEGSTFSLQIPVPQSERFKITSR